MKGKRINHEGDVQGGGEREHHAEQGSSDGCFEEAMRRSRGRLPRRDL